MECVRNCWILLMVMVFWENHVIEVLSQTAGKLTCPVKWTEQSTVTLICEVFESSVDAAACPGNNGEFSFAFTSKNGFQVKSCTLSSYFNAACDGIFNANGCRCKEKTGNNTYILQYNVTVDAARYQGGSWQCLPACDDSSYLPVIKTFDQVGNCTDLHIETLTTTTTGTTADSTNNKTAEPPGDLKWWVILIIVVGAICLLASLILFILTFWFWNPKYLTGKVWWFILLMVLACICVLGIIIVVIILLKCWKGKEKKEFSPPRQPPNENGQRGDPNEGGKETNSTSQSSDTPM